MGFRFSKRAKILPGVYLNIGKSGASVSLGPRGLKTTIGAKGIKGSIGLPGTGMSYQTKYKKWGSFIPGNGSSSSAKSSAKKPAAAAKSVPENDSVSSDIDKLNLGFFARLTRSKEEKAFAAGLQAFLKEDYDEAENLLKQALSYADSAFTLGIMYLNNEQFEDAEDMLRAALKKSSQIGSMYKKYELEMKLHIAISNFYDDEFEPCRLTAELALVEALQQTEGYAEALDILKAAHAKNKNNVIVTMSLADLILDNEPENADMMNFIVDITGNLENETYAHAVLMMYRAEAFDNLGLTDAAISTLTAAFRKKKDRAPEFLLEVQYQRAVLYMKQNKNSLALKELQAVFAIDSSYSNVKELMAKLQEQGE